MNKPKRQTICFINSVKSWGGGEKWHYEMALRLKAKGLPILFICRKDSVLAEKLREKEIPVGQFQINNLSFLNIYLILKIRRFLKNNAVDTVIMNFSADLKTSGPAAKWAGVKHIIYRRGSAIPIKNTFLNRILFKQVLTGLIANSAATRQTIIQNNQNLFPKEKIRVIYNGLEIPELPVKAETQHGFTRDIILGNVGRLVTQKGQIYLVELSKKLKERGVKFKMLIGGSGPLEQELKNQTLAAGLEEEITFTGFVTDINRFMQSIDLFLLPSLWEGFGFVIAEAMLNARPVIAWDLSSNPELIQHHKTGFLVPPFETDLFCNYVIDLIEDDEKRNIFGQRGRQLAVDKFSIDKAVNSLEEYLQQADTAKLRV